MEEILASIRRIISDDQSLAAHRDPVHIEQEPAPVLDVKTAMVSPPQAPIAGNVQLERPHLNAGIHDAAKVAAMEDHSAFADLAYPASPQVATLDRKYADFADLRLRRQLSDDEDRAPARHLADPAPRPTPTPRQSAEPVPLPIQAPATQQATYHDEEPIVSAATDAAVASSFNALFASRLLPDPEMLAELTRDLLRPMLKTWLDDNLPVMVERLVRAEIERVARGGR